MTTELGREMERVEAEALRAALDAINEIALINEQLSPLNARKAVLVEQVKQHLQLSGASGLHDGETGVEAKLQTRTASPTFDLMRASQENAQAVVDAGSAGMLRLDSVMFTRFRKGNGALWSDTLARYEMPGSVTDALIVEKNARA